MLQTGDSESCSNIHRVDIPVARKKVSRAGDWATRALGEWEFLRARSFPRSGSFTPGDPRLSPPCSTNGEGARHPMMIAGAEFVPEVWISRRDGRRNRNRIRFSGSFPFVIPLVPKLCLDTPRSQLLLRVPGCGELPVRAARSGSFARGVTKRSLVTRES